MTSLFGITQVPTINDFIGTPAALKFNQWLEGVFPPVGYNGTPDLSTDPMSTYQYLNNRRQTILDSANQKPLVRIADKNLNIVATVSEEMSCVVEELMADSGKATCILRFDNWLTSWIVNETSIYEDLHLLVDPIPTYPTVDGVPQDWQIRWGGKITEVNIKNNEDGTSTVELQAISQREHVKRLLFAANPVFPPEVPAPAGAPKGALAGAGASELRNSTSAHVGSTRSYPLHSDAVYVHKFGPDLRSRVEFHHECVQPGRMDQPAES